MSEVAAIVLAAGRGTRFGEEPKLLANLDGKPLVRWAVEAALGARLAPVVVVTGHRAEDVGEALAGLPVELTHNPSYGEGLSTSLQAGFQALPRSAAAAVVLLGDMPLVSASIVNQLAVAWQERGQPAALVPVTGGRRSNPVVLSCRLAPEIMALQGDVGAGPLLRGRADVGEFPLEDPALLQDIDTAEALSALRR